METFFTKWGVFEQLTTYATTKWYTVHFTDSYPDGGQTNTIDTGGDSLGFYRYTMKSDWQGNMKLNKEKKEKITDIGTLVTEAKKLF
jgi:hypothetical protein